MNRVRITEGSVDLASRFNVTAGCDVDGDFVVVCCTNWITARSEIREIPQTEKQAKLTAKWLKESGAEFIVLESTANYHLLFYHAFRDAKLNVHVINPMQVKALLRVEGKSDKADATNLSILAATFPLRTSNMPDEAQREIRDNLRRRDKDMANRQVCHQRIHQLLAECGISIFKKTSLRTIGGQGMLRDLAYTLNTASEIVEANYRGSRNRIPALLEALGSPEKMPKWQRLELRLLVEDLASWNTRVDVRVERALEHIEKFELAPQVAWMTTTPAVDQLLALRIIGEMGHDFWLRYPTSRAFCRALGIAPNTLVSAGKVLKTQKALGNRFVRAHLLMNMQTWLLHGGNHPLKQWQLGYKEKTSFRRSVSAAAHRAMKSLWYQGLYGGEIYDAKRAFRAHKLASYSGQSDAPSDDAAPPLG